MSLRDQAQATVAHARRNVESALGIPDEPSGRRAGGVQMTRTEPVLDREALAAEMNQRLNSVSTETSRRREARAEQRRQFAEARSIGKRAHHAARLHGGNGGRR
jgi:hypothetical protein